ncbi:hypothetical protein Pelo_2393 [Pelomyxa schiedti]|nr:hypothetical protein Pelo_2393 [Pelomyxa schiedti]
MMRAGLKITEHMIAQHPTNPTSHKWYAVLLASMGDFLSTKERIQSSFTIKEHALEAAKGLPTDSTVRHLLGRWCFNVAGFV